MKLGKFIARTRSTGDSLSYSFCVWWQIGVVAVCGWVCHKCMLDVAAKKSRNEAGEEKEVKDAVSEL